MRDHLVSSLWRLHERTSAAVVIAAIVITLADALPATAQAKDPSDPRPRLVVLLDWDGFDPDFLVTASAPNLRALIRRGSLSIAQSTFPTVSNPARASMSTGAYPEVHNNAAYYFDPVANRAVGQGRAMEAETLAEALSRAGRHVASVQWYLVRDRGTSYGDPEHLYVEPGGPFERRVDAAIDILKRRPVGSGDEMVTVPTIPDFLAVYGDDFDALGHREGAESPNIGPLLVEMDRQLGRLVDAVEEIGLAGRTAFLLTSDHGMTSWNKTLLPAVLAAVTAAGYRTEVVTAGSAPAPEAEVIIVPNAERYGDITLRGRAATTEGRAAVKTALETLSPALVSDVLDKSDLAPLRTSPKVGDFLVEARPPYAFVPSDLPPGEWKGAHGSREELSVPLVIAGRGFLSEAVPTDPAIIDVAPTIAALLGVEPPRQAQGRAWTEAMDSALRPHGPGPRWAGRAAG
jgi:arylsulfatase A-like enzyme